MGLKLLRCRPGSPRGVTYLTAIAAICTPQNAPMRKEVLRWTGWDRSGPDEVGSGPNFVYLALLNLTRRVLLTSKALAVRPTERVLGSSG